ncbi:hypothetical protein HG530_012117 [Fusarium avenaceum]|nr:hypothetical protein HG530_012117 [Fusarium avenaceum]
MLRFFEDDNNRLVYRRELWRAHAAGDTLPVPYRDPVALAHANPYFLEKFHNAFAVTETRVSSNGSYSSTDTLLLGSLETCSADDEARNEQQGLGRVGRFEGLKDGERFFNGEGNSAIVVCRSSELVLDGLRDVGQLLATWASEASQAPLPLDTVAIIEARLTGGGGGTETDAEVGIGRVLNVERRMEETEGG